MAKDFFGKEIKVKDNVVFTQPKTEQLTIGVVETLSFQTLVIQYGEGFNVESITLPHDQVIVKKFKSELQKVKILQDSSKHWYIVPDILASEFQEDESYLTESEVFCQKWGKYKIGGLLNDIPLWTDWVEL